MHTYRTHTCGQLRLDQAGQIARLSGWIHRKRDHGNLLFIDLRDHYGITQCVIDVSSPVFAVAETLRLESVITVTGKVVARTAETVNDRLPTGTVELDVAELDVRSRAEMLPLQVNADQDSGEDVRLKYRFLDLRRETLHNNIMTRVAVVADIRARMTAVGFNEFSTPILTASSPEGARDFLVPSRIHAGKFYALPQAPQQYKQLLMVAGFDRYFQIAPCFRDEDPRADRLPGEFYQLDLEMSFVTQEEIWETMEPVIQGTFAAFAGDKTVTPAGEFPRIPYDEAMLKYGSDKPDLRNPLIISDVSSHFTQSGFGLFEKIVVGGGVVRAIPAPGTHEKSRKFFDEMNDWARREGFAGLGYVTRKAGEFGGPIAKNHGADRMAELYAELGLGENDGLFFAAGKQAEASKLAGAARIRVGEELGLIDENAFALAWIVDFPFYEWNEDEKKVDFSHNPFSMPQGGIDALNGQDPLTIKAFQYDLVCNGYEIASGSIRNHMPETMVKAFELVGLSKADVEERFGGMYRAFQYGAPPHGGMAAGVDRIVMLLCGVKNLREISLFPMNQRAEDLLMGAPTPAEPRSLRELHLRVVEPPVKPAG
jgi:aspartyl-tRNA synthetase